jgi:predicted Zn finger-like uncharacterized protein
MTLATRCPQCGTTFRVVSDQLKLRKGLVKCGKCLHVFNGIEFLHYFSEPIAPASGETPAVGATGAPTPEFLGVDDEPSVSAPHTAAPASAPTMSDAAAAPPMVEPAPQTLPSAPTPAPTPAPVDPAPAMAPAPIEPEAPASLAKASHGAGAESAQIESGATEVMIDAAADLRIGTPTDAMPEGGHDQGATATAEDRSSARAPWYARLGHGAMPAPAAADAAPKPEPAAEENIVAAPAPVASRDDEIDAIAEMRERVARARQAAEADDSAATLSPLTLIDVARQPSETVEDRFEELPAFLRERRRAPAWLRVLIVVLALLAALALFGQAAYVYRAEIAAEFPALRPTLAAACAALPDPLRCEVGLPRHITPLRVVSADLQPGEGGNFNLVVAIHNDDTLPMAYPALDVILTDAHTQVLIRRVINADEYLGAHRDAADRRRVGLAGNAETSITVPMHIADEGVVGYTVGIFYP